MYNCVVIVLPRVASNKSSVVIVRCYLVIVTFSVVIVLLLRCSRVIVISRVFHFFYPFYI